MAIRDKDIREALFDFLETEYGKIRIIEEKTMGRSRADVVMVTEDALFGLEMRVWTRMNMHVLWSGSNECPYWRDGDEYTVVKHQI